MGMRRKWKGRTERETGTTRLSLSQGESGKTTRRHSALCQVRHHHKTRLNRGVKGLRAQGRRTISTAGDVNTRRHHARNQPRSHRARPNPGEFRRRTEWPDDEQGEQPSEGERTRAIIPMRAEPLEKKKAKSLPTPAGDVRTGKPAEFCPSRPRHPADADDQNERKKPYLNRKVAGLKIPSTSPDPSDPPPPL